MRKEGGKKGEKGGRRGERREKERGEKGGKEREKEGREGEETGRGESEGVWEGKELEKGIRGVLEQGLRARRTSALARGGTRATLRYIFIIIEPRRPRHATRIGIMAHYRQETNNTVI